MKLTTRWVSEGLSLLELDLYAQIHAPASALCSNSWDVYTRPTHVAYTCTRALTTIFTHFLLYRTKL